MSIFLHAAANALLHSLLNILVQIANKMGLQKKLVGNRIPVDNGGLS
jgi:hypothetical protein